MNFLNGLGDKVSSRPLFFFSTLAVLCVVIALYVYSKKAAAKATVTRAVPAREQERVREAHVSHGVVDGHDVVGFQGGHGGGGGGGGGGGNGDDSDEMLDDRVEHYASGSEGGYGGSEGGHGSEDDHEILESDEDVDTYE